MCVCGILILASKSQEVNFTLKVPLGIWYAFAITTMMMVLWEEIPLPLSALGGF